MSDNQVKQSTEKPNLRQLLELPEPRVWKPQDLAGFLRVSVGWVHKRASATAQDPIPRIIGVGRLRFDTANPKFLEWIQRQLGYTNTEGNDE